MTSYPEAENNETSWKRLEDHLDERFYRGLLLRFKTNDTDRPTHWQYGLAVSYNGSKRLSFVSLDGGTWGYGRAELPDASFYEGQPYTVSALWLLNNFEHLCSVGKTDDIWFCESFVPVPNEKTG